MAFSMVDDLFNILHPFLALFSCLGVICLIKNRKTCIVIVSIVLFGLLWRLFAYSSSSRYYTVFILFGSLLTGYGVLLLLRFSSNKVKWQSLYLLLLFLLLYTNTTDVFGSFNNKYLIDIREMVGSGFRDNPNSATLIHQKDITRITQHLHTNNEPFAIPSNSKINIHNFYLSKNLLGRNAYFIIPEKELYKDNKTSRDEFFHMVGSFIKNSKRNDHMLIYRHLSFVPNPDIDVTQFYKDAILKAYIPEYNAFIYLVDDKIVWLIGVEIETKTEIVYQIFTDKPALLPESRIKYGFDNLAFRAYKNDKEYVGSYRLFERAIPTRYPVTLVRVGFNTDGHLICRDFYLHANPGR